MYFFKCVSSIYNLFKSNQMKINLFKVQSFTVKKKNMVEKLSVYINV